MTTLLTATLTASTIGLLVALVIESRERDEIQRENDDLQRELAESRRQVDQLKSALNAADAVNAAHAAENEKPAIYDVGGMGMNFRNETEAREFLDDLAVFYGDDYGLPIEKITEEEIERLFADAD